MNFLFVYASFTRAGKNHSVLKDAPLIAHGRVFHKEQYHILDNGLEFMMDGTNIILGEIYQVSSQQLQILDNMYQNFAFIRKKIKVECLCGPILECYYYTLTPETIHSFKIEKKIPPVKQ